MLREVACLFPRMQASLSLMNEAASNETDVVSSRIYPPAAFDDAGRQALEDALRATRVAQPAIGAISLGLLRILDGFGVRPDLVGGHSFGELTALCAAGRIDDAALATLSDRRGALMAACASTGTGAMLAVFAPIAEVSALLREHDLSLVIANKNAPRQCVLSGSSEEIDRGRRILADRRITTRPVAVAAAFHSRFVAEAEGPFRKAVATVDIRTPTIPVYANTTAEPYPDDPESVRDLLAGQLARPVEFVAQVEAMYRDGARTFLEVGPDAKLTGLVRSILEGREHLAIAVDASRGSASNVHDLACALATLAALGYAVDLNQWDEGESARAAPARKPGLTVRISGANARPKDRPTSVPAEKSAPVTPPVPEPPGRQAAAPRTPRISLSEAMDPTMPDTQTRHHAENHRTMNQPERIPSHHSNGHASTHALLPPQAVEEPEPRHRVRPQSQDLGAPTDLAFAFHAAQENLSALQRLAEQTADLHRQFLEGQEKTQQTFLKLLERQQHLSHAMTDPAQAHRIPAPAASPKRELPELPGAGVQAIETPAPKAERKDPSSAPGFEDFATLSVQSPPTQGETPAMPDHPVTMALIEVVAEKTGYPAEVLDLDMQLDADLGIDSIKRVEILSALQERYPDLPSLPPEQLGSFRTLRAIAEIIGRGREITSVDRFSVISDRLKAEPQSTDPSALDGVPPSAGMRERSADRLKPELQPQNPPGSLEHAQVLLETVAEKTGYPTEMLDLDMRLDADLGIDSIKRVEILSALQERFPAPPADGSRTDRYPRDLARYRLPTG